MYLPLMEKQTEKNMQNQNGSWDCTRVSRGRLSKRYLEHKGFAQKGRGGGATQPTWRFMGLSN